MTGEEIQLEINEQIHARLAAGQISKRLYLSPSYFKKLAHWLYKNGTTVYPARTDAGKDGEAGEYRGLRIYTVTTANHIHVC